MGNRILPLELDTFYHVYNRGFNKQTLFYDVKDYRRFLDTVVRYKFRFNGICIQSYCLLPNHFHFLLKDTPADNLNSTDASGLRVRTTGPDRNTCEISSFMQKVQQSYALYFNNRYGDSVKKGLKMPVFEGRFKAKEILDDNYLERLVAYIEYNAVKHEIVDDVKDWPYSSWEPERNFAPEDDFFADFD